MRVLIVGCGYVGMPLGAELAKLGHEVHGIRRGKASDDQLIAAGIRPLVADITQPADLDRLPRDWDWVVNCVSANDSSAEGYLATYLQGTANLLNWLRERAPSKYVYTSSTGVYGQDDGSWVAEGDITQEPGTPTGTVLVETERLLRGAWEKEGFPAVVLRLAGIYGPERGYWLRQFLSGEARLENGGVRWLNMIHRDDVVGAIAAALRRGKPGEIYNVVDTEPVTQLACFQWLADTLGRPLPPPAAPLSGTARRRSATNKRISSRKLREELGYEFKFPTFREGYGAELRRLGEEG